MHIKASSAVQHLNNVAKVHVLASAQMTLRRNTFQCIGKKVEAGPTAADNCSQQGMGGNSWHNSVDIKILMILKKGIKRASSVP